MFTPIPPEAVRAYDVRGIAGRQVTEGGFFQLGLSYAARARAQQLLRIGVARDGRLSSPVLERAVVAGLVAGGMAVERIGLAPTPQLGFAVRALGLDGAIMVTASHNPPEENGLKLLLGGERINGAALKALVEAEGAPAQGGLARDLDVSEEYLRALMGGGGDLRPLRVAWDCGNGATGPMLERLAARLPGRHMLLNAEVDGRFPNHPADPAVAANLTQLQATVVEHGCDLGVAFDGDGDRIGVVDESGTAVASDHLLLFLAQDLLGRRPGAAVVGDVKSSRLLFQGVARAGGRAVMSPSGYVLTRQTMEREGALLAGELSGHIFFGEDWDGTDDGLYVAMRVLSLVSRRGHLAAMRRALPPSFATPEVRIACAEPDRVLRELSGGKALDPQMGLRQEGADGWWLVRVSGTEAKITCRCESDSERGLQRLVDALMARLGACDVDCADRFSPDRSRRAG